jgi:hypothetical protein
MLLLINFVTTIRKRGSISFTVEESQELLNLSE